MNTPDVDAGRLERRVRLMIDRLLPTVHFSLSNYGLWYLTKSSGDKYYCWLLFGHIVRDDMKAWQLIVWRVRITIGWP